MKFNYYPPSGLRMHVNLIEKFVDLNLERTHIHIASYNRDDTYLCCELVFKYIQDGRVVTVISFLDPVIYIKSILNKLNFRGMKDCDKNLSFVSAIETITESLVVSSDNPILKVFENLVVDPIAESVVIFCGLSALVNCGVDLSKIYFYLSQIGQLYRLITSIRINTHSNESLSFNSQISFFSTCLISLKAIKLRMAKHVRGQIVLQSYGLQNSEETYWYGINKNRLSIHHIQEQLNVL